MFKGVYLAIACLVLVSSILAATIIVPDHHPTVQGAINASTNGDTIIVRPGVYVENIDFAGKDIVVRSEKGPEVTIIDGNKNGKSVVTIVNNETPAAVLQGFTLTNGQSRQGGGIFIEFSSPTIKNNNIIGNEATVLYGGGIACRRDSVSAVIANNRIVGNKAATLGGGIYWFGYDVSFYSNVIAYNTAKEGAGVYFDSNASYLINSTIFGNSATIKGGGVHTNMYGASVRVRNRIVWSNSAPQEPNLGAEDYWYGYDVLNSDIQGVWVGNYPGTANVEVDPQFVDQNKEDFHLKYNSPCKGAGNNSYISQTTDFEGDPRISDGTVDMGADEFHPHLYMIGSPIPGSPVEVKVIGEPTNRVLLALSNKVLDPPIPTGHGDLYLKLPLLAQWNLGTMNSDGVKVMPANIPMGWAPGSEHPFQAFVGTWGVQGTLTNLLLVTVK